MLAGSLALLTAALARPANALGASPASGTLPELGQLFVPPAVSLRPAVGPGPAPTVESVDIVRDSHGVPHVYATSERGAFYGLGWATARDRLFQMEFTRRAMRGTLAAVFDKTAYPGALPSDKAARYVGWGPFADQLAIDASAADAELALVLDAYCDGVNAYKASLGSNLPGLFPVHGIASFDDWTPGDCVLAWISFQMGLTPGWLAEPGVTSCPTNPNVEIDASGAVLPNGYLYAATLDDLRGPRRVGPADVERKASHNVAIAGWRSTSNGAFLLGKPQHLLTAPSLYYECSVKGGAYDCRGVSIPGAPGFVHGFNRNVAWSLTGMPADQTDVYRLQRQPGDPGNTYRLDGVPTWMSTRTETIHVENAADVTVTWRGTVFGPVVTQVLQEVGSLVPPYNQLEDYASAMQVLRDDDQTTIQGMLGLMRATNWASARTAMQKWRGPTAHLLYADTSGNIGYTALGAVPVRAPNDPCSVEPGSQVLNGTTTVSHWQGTIAFGQMPWTLNPESGYLSTGNNLAAPPSAVPHGYVLGAVGDTTRSWRLRERLEELFPTPTSKVSSAQVLGIHKDTVVPTLRVFAQLAAQMRANGDLTPAAEVVAEQLSHWNDGQAPADHWRVLASNPQALLLDRINAWISGFRGQGTPWDHLIHTYGAGVSGLVAFLKVVEVDIPGAVGCSGPDVHCDAVKAWVDNRLIAAGAGYPPPGPGCSVRNPLATGEFTLVHQPRLCKAGSCPCSIDPTLDFEVDLQAPSGDTIWSQAGEAYSFLATMRNPDNSGSISPPGSSELVGSPLFTSQMVNWPAGSQNPAPWLAGTLYPAPLTRSLVESDCPTPPPAGDVPCGRVTLSYTY